MFFFLFLLTFLSSTATAADFPVLISSGVGYSVSLADGTLGGPVLSHGVRTVVTWGDSGWTSIEDFGFITGTLAFQPCPRWVGDISHQVTEDGLRLGAAYGLKYTPSFDGADSSTTASLGPVVIKSIKGIGGVALVLPLNYNMAAKASSVGLSFVYVVKFFNLIHSNLPAGFF